MKLACWFLAAAAAFAQPPQPGSRTPGSQAISQGADAPPPAPVPRDPVTPAPSERAVVNLARQIQQRILTLPQYGVFDSLRFGIKGYTVYLRGYASRPTLKSSAENVVKRIEGVEKVVNEIEVLPLSPADDEIRARAYYAIYSHPALSRFNPNRGARLPPSLAARSMGITQDPPIGYHPVHILVKNGVVTLEGFLPTSEDRTIAEMQANTVPGAFSVIDNIDVGDEGKIAKPKKK